MIFVEDNCPLCGKKLQCAPGQVLDGLGNILVKKTKTYYCNANTEKPRNGTNMIIREAHYNYEFNVDAHSNNDFKDDRCRMVILLYIILHTEFYTNVCTYEDGHFKIIFSVPLLDMDYSQPQVVVERIKLLTLFS